MSKRIDPITRIIELYRGLTEFERGRFAQAMLDAGNAPQQPAATRGRPVGSKNKRSNGAAATDPTVTAMTTEFRSHE